MGSEINQVVNGGPGATELRTEKSNRESLEKAISNFSATASYIKPHKLELSPADEKKLAGNFILHSRTITNVPDRIEFFVAATRATREHPQLSGSLPAVVAEAFGREALAWPLEGLPPKTLYRLHRLFVAAQVNDKDKGDWTGALISDRDPSSGYDYEAQGPGDVQQVHAMQTRIIDEFARRAKAGEEAPTRNEVQETFDRQIAALRPGPMSGETEYSVDDIYRPKVPRRSEAFKDWVNSPLQSGLKNVSAGGTAAQRGEAARKSRE